jgi:hypothetical protein
VSGFERAETMVKIKSSKLLALVEGTWIIFMSRFQRRKHGEKSKRALCVFWY